MTNSKNLSLTRDEIDHLFLALLSHAQVLETERKTMYRTPGNEDYMEHQYDINLKLAIELSRLRQDMYNKE